MTIVSKLRSTRALAAAIGLALAASSLPAAAQLSFSNAPSPAVGASPRSIAVADFNRDHIDDLVVGNAWDGTVSILLGNGNGTFRAQSQLAVGGLPVSMPFGVATGDFNGDGKADLALANYSNGTASILRGKGDGTFEAQVSFSVGSFGNLSPAPIAITTADFNRDGRLDVALANFNDFAASVLLGNGDGTLGTRATYPTGVASLSIASGDFNHDGRADLAVSNAAEANVSVLLGNGDGSFAAQRAYPVGHQPRAVASFDFNGDGRDDVAVVNRDDATVSVLIANADGTFKPQVTFATGTAPRGLAVGDFNGDGKADLAVADSSSNSASLLAGRGDGTFAARVVLPAGTEPHAVAVGDFNGDGKDDVALANYTCEQCQGSVSVLLNKTTFVNDTVTGTWFTPSRAGQGFTFEVFPNTSGPGLGLIAGQWFTFAAGAPDGDAAQRWFSLQAAFPNIQGPAPFLLYQNVGGNFDGPPPTTPTVVGQGLVSFDSCGAGRIDYTLSIGGGSAGSFPIQRLTPSMACASAGGTTTYPDPGLSGIWYDPQNPGQGFFFDINPNTPKLFGAWYTYAPGGAAATGPGSQRWYTLQLDTIANTRSFADIPIYQTTGGSFDQTPATAPVSPRVGTASLSFASCTAATLSYSFDGGTNAGLSGSIALARIGAPPASCR